MSDKPSTLLPTLCPCDRWMDTIVAPVAEKVEKAGRLRYKVPARYCRLEGAINIERVGPAAQLNDYICREEDCIWHKEAVREDSARLHAKSHSETRKCHIFEGHLSAEQLAAREKELKQAVNKRYRERQREKRKHKPGQDQDQGQAPKKPRSQVRASTQEEGDI